MDITREQLFPYGPDWIIKRVETSQSVTHPFYLIGEYNTPNSKSHGKEFRWGMSPEHMNDWRYDYSNAVWTTDALKLVLSNTSLCFQN